MHRPQNEAAAFVAVVPNDLTAYAPVVESLAAECLASDLGSYAVHNHHSAMTNRLRRFGNERVIVPDGAEAPSLREIAENAHLRGPFLAEQVREDRFLARLALPGQEVGRVNSIVWDRLQYGIYPVDWRPFIAALPWHSVGRVELIGGMSFASPIPMLLAAAARDRNLPVRGQVLGPVRGRFAPEWLPACTEIVVGTRHAARTLTEVLGCEARVTIDPRLVPPAPSTSEGFGGDAPRPVLLDLHVATPRAPVRHALQRFLDRHAAAVERFVLPASYGDRAHFAALFGSEIGGVPLQCVPGSIHRHARQTDDPMLSFAPYRGLWAGGVTGHARAETWILEDEAACGGEVPEALRPFLLETDAGVPA